MVWGPSARVWPAGTLLGLSGPRKLPTKPGVNKQVLIAQGMEGRGGVGTHGGAHSAELWDSTEHTLESGQGVFSRFTC